MRPTTCHPPRILHSLTLHTRPSKSHHHHHRQFQFQFSSSCRHLPPPPPHSILTQRSQLSSRATRKPLIIQQSPQHPPPPPSRPPKPPLSKRLKKRLLYAVGIPPTLVLVLVLVLDDELWTELRAPTTPPFLNETTFTPYAIDSITPLSETSTSSIFTLQAILDPRLEPQQLLAPPELGGGGGGVSQAAPQDAIYSVAVKQPQLQIERDYTP
ncbi:MAG: hypothetical protein M1816_000442, partial [Peltula sp. TS41687]